MSNHTPDWVKDLSDSARDFVKIVWPRIANWCGRGELVPTEGVTVSEMQRNLDILAGIDAWQIVNAMGMRGIASRVQYCDGDKKPWASFTVRRSRATGAETEWDKRARAFDEPDRKWLTPSLVVQAYISTRTDGELLYVCMVRAGDLYRLLDDDLEGNVWELQVNGADGNTFAVFWVDWLKRHGVDVKVWCAEGVCPGRPVPVNSCPPPPPLWPENFLP